MLSGYTALFISLPYVDSPLSIFNVVLARVEEIGLGIICYMAIDLLLFPRKSHGLYLSTLSRAQQLIASWQQAIASQPTEHHLELRQSLLQCLRQCDDLRQQALRDSHRLRGHEALLLELRCADEGGPAFAEAAKKWSNCPSGAEGGDLGWLTREDCAPEFARDVFEGQEIGVLARLVHSRFGLHVVQVCARQKPEAKPFEQVHAAVAQQIGRASCRERVSSPV